MFVRIASRTSLCSRAGFIWSESEPGKNVCWACAQAVGHHQTTCQRGNKTDTMRAAKQLQSAA